MQIEWEIEIAGIGQADSGLVVEPDEDELAAMETREDQIEHIRQLIQADFELMVSPALDEHSLELPEPAGEIS
jgi:hypothetical protein